MRPACQEISGESPHDVVYVQCLGCGAELSAHRSGLVRCERCGGLDFHVVDPSAPVTQVTVSSRAGAPDNTQVIDRLMALVDAVYGARSREPH